MPIFQDPDRQQSSARWSDDQRAGQNQSQSDTCCWVDYHGISSEPQPSEPVDNFPYQKSSSDRNVSRPPPHDREELINYIKSAETSKWSQHFPFGDKSAGHFSHPRTPEKRLGMREYFTGRDAPQDDTHTAAQELASPAEIERPRSALHSGDFREGTPELQGQQQLPQSPLPGQRDASQFSLFSSSPTTPWFAAPFSHRTQSALVHSLEESAIETTRSRAPSIGSSYVLKAPTSPLVHQANNSDLDFSPRDETATHPSAMDKSNRRRTLPPESFRNLQASSPALNTTSHVLSGKWNDPLIYQPYTPRRSLASAYSLQLASSVQNSSPQKLRRPSLASEVPSRVHAPMVGSYEECILRGRMSTNPSKPLDFTAQIGVLGKGKCKPSLKCPPHVTVPFPAVFYSYPTSGQGRSISDDSPSPYVGMIDLDHSLPRDTSNNNRRRKRYQSPAGLYRENSENLLQSLCNETDTPRRREKRHRRAESPKSPSGGCYRIPQQGQLQVMIKNPNKTAVKLFLIPYDLSDMEPGTKTFIRQRSYSAGPIIDMPLTARSNYGTDRPEAALNPTDDPKDKPILRYLIHLNICCPSRGRFYLHSSIRVVFANRVPDGKEKLRNEIQHPDPRYSPYKPSRESSSQHLGTKFLRESGLSKLDSSQASASASVYMSQMAKAGKFSSPDYSSGSSGTRLHVTPKPACDEAATWESLENISPSERPLHPFQPIPSLRDSIFRMPAAGATQKRPAENEFYNKLNRGDTGYGGHPYNSSSTLEPGASLLAKRLRGLDVQTQDFTYIP